MFAKSIIGSARFLRMPPSSRLLYYDLGMYADDEGVVEAFTVMRQTNATEDDLRVLVSKGFVKILNEDLVTVIMDWDENNYIRSDRKRKSIYNNLLLEMARCQTDGRQMPDKCQTDDSIGKDRLGNNNEQTDHYESEFAELWKLYPNKKGKKNALKYYIRARKNGTTYEQVEAGIMAYIEYIRKTKAQMYIKHGSTFFNEEGWDDDWSVGTPTLSKMPKADESTISDEEFMRIMAQHEGADEW